MWLASHIWVVKFLGCAQRARCFQMEGSSGFGGSSELFAWRNVSSYIVLTSYTRTPSVGAPTCLISLKRLICSISSFVIRAPSISTLTLSWNSLSSRRRLLSVDEQGAVQSHCSSRNSPSLRNTHTLRPQSTHSRWATPQIQQAERQGGHYRFLPTPGTSICMGRRN